MFSLNDDWGADEQDLQLNLFGKTSCLTQLARNDRNNRKRKKNLIKNSESSLPTDKLGLKRKKGAKARRRSKDKDGNGKLRVEKDLSVECEQDNYGVHSTRMSSRASDKFTQRLLSGRFRWVNERLYNISGSDAYKMFQQDPHLFEVYHNGFTAQVRDWPINPLDNVIEYLRSRPTDLIIADLGCGEGKLGRSIENKVYSIDLVAYNSNIIPCDMANTPLKKRSIDIVVFCLSLMGTNLQDYLREAYRVLKPRGVLLIVEVLSRIVNIDAFVSSLLINGFQLESKCLLSKMFIQFEFIKLAKKTNVYISTNAAAVSLKPCVYKKR